MLQVGKDERDALRQVLEALEADGLIHLTERGKYVKGAARSQKGIFQAHARGFGFVTVDGEEEDIFIPEKYIGGALHKDQVRITVKPSSGKSLPFLCGPVCPPF